MIIKIFQINYWVKNNMNERFEKYINKIFRGVRETREVKEIKEELDALEKSEMDKLRQFEIETCRAEMKKSAIHGL